MSTQHEREKDQVVTLLTTQIEVEQKLVSLYEETCDEMQSTAVQRLLSAMYYDSQKHIEICQLVIEVLQGTDILRAERQELLTGLKRHITLEKEAINTANQVLKNEWMRETKGLKELIT